MCGIRENLEKIRGRIAKAAQKSGRNPEEISLVAVTKTVDVDSISEGLKAGLNILGENRVQEAERKIGHLGHGVEWHLIGHLQTNKVKRAIDLFDLIHSVDSIHLAAEIDKTAASKGKRIPVLLEVDLAGEETKFGFTEDEVKRSLDQLAGFPCLHIQGLMIIPPFSADPEDSRPYFRKLFQIKEGIASQRIEAIGMKHLSMGMSNDFEVAIEEGADMVRIGTAIFGSRSSQ